MESICQNCEFAGGVATKLRDEGWVGCRKVLEILQAAEMRDDLSITNKTTEEVSAEVYQEITCRDAATGWVGTTRIDRKPIKKINGVLMTRGTTMCRYHEQRT